MDPIAQTVMNLSTLLQHWGSATAVAAFAYGGVLHTLHRGNPMKKAEATEVMIGAGVGLALCILAPSLASMVTGIVP